MSKGRVAEKVFVVTGSTQGIGEGVAMHLAREGAAGVVICGRNEERGRAVEAALEGAGSKAFVVRAELANEAGCREVIAACDRKCR